ncbi:MAG TPA: hypothetical protein VJ103_01295 [Candidatus Paceibacterota bacterium]|nr:hypothetical protein [Candidatus Paceibacterota bacterium]
MNTIAIPKNLIKNAFKAGGEEFVVLKKDHLNELYILMQSVIAGDEAFKKGKTRSFSDFLKKTYKKK